MEVILKEDIKFVGYKNDIVKVKPGFGRNYLIPQGKAIIATPSNRKVVEENLRQAGMKLAKQKEDAGALLKTLEGLTLKVGAKVGESGKIFGAVTNIQIAEALSKAGHEVDRRKIDIKDAIKTIGEYTATIDLHKEVKANITFEVIAE
ncbi:MAG: large subunit ribosomal protein L9 [Sphingobacteriales bacterium]|jgi:large subunit ribosomal protein L9